MNYFKMLNKFEVILMESLKNSSMLKTSIPKENLKIMTKGRLDDFSNYLNPKNFETNYQIKIPYFSEDEGNAKSSGLKSRTHIGVMKQSNGDMIPFAHGKTHTGRRADPYGRNIQQYHTWFFPEHRNLNGLDGDVNNLSKMIPENWLDELSNHTDNIMMKNDTKDIDPHAVDRETYQRHVDNVIDGFRNDFPENIQLNNGSPISKHNILSEPEKSYAAEKIEEQNRKIEQQNRKLKEIEDQKIKNKLKNRFFSLIGRGK